jgi:5-methylcytosine-specific restriction endonuclease McrA
MDRRQQREFMRRSANIYRHQRDRAREYGQELPYRLPDFRELVVRCLDGLCLYCGRPLTVANFSADHSDPTSCSRDFHLANVEIVCLRCNQTKGVMSAQEFLKLLQALKDFRPKTRQDVLARLRAGGRLTKLR